MDFSFPFLSVITLSPIVAAVIILLMPKERPEAAKMVAVVAMVLGLVLSAYVYYSYNSNLPPESARWAETLQFMESVEWVPRFGISYTLGVDGLSATLVFLTAIVGLAGALISWGVSDRPHEFYAFFMLLVAGVHGVFVAVDAFLLFLFYELAVLPMYVMILIWGWKERREYAAMKLTLFLLIGSFVSFIAFLVLYNTPLVDTGQSIGTFDLRAWAEASFPIRTQIIWFMPMFFGFAILAGTFPFHNWSPDGHVAAPTAVSMIHAGVLMKLGAYASMRVGIQIMPEGTVYWMPFVILLTLVNVIYGSLIAMRQNDMKYMIGYSSVSHMGLVAMGFAAMNIKGFVGAGIQMVSHGVMTAMFFSVVGMIYDRAHSRDMTKLSGMAKALPWTVVAFIVGGLVSMGMPGLSGFIAEFPIFLGVWEGGSMGLRGTFLNLSPDSFYPWVAIISAIAIVITAAYILRAITAVFFGEYDEHAWHDMRPINGADKFVLVMFMTILIGIGIFPNSIGPIVESGIRPVVERVNEARATTGGVADATTVVDSLRIAATQIMNWMGGA